MTMTTMSIFARTATPTRRLRTALVAAATLAAPAAASAQLARLPGDSAGGWPAIEIGIRAGYDNGLREELVGALLRVPVLPSGRVELMPNMDVTFLRGLKEYQYNLDAVYLTVPGEGGLYAGGGIGLRSTILPSDPAAGRQTITTWNLVIGAKFEMGERLNPMVEFRRAFTSDLAVDPQQISLGATIELW
ncbi:MAG: hypothetical protein WEB90_08425 [Gemmatimonadota bacterium]